MIGLLPTPRVTSLSHQSIAMIKLGLIATSSVLQILHSLVSLGTPHLGQSSPSLKSAWQNQRERFELVPIVDINTHYGHIAVAATDKPNFRDSTKHKRRASTNAIRV